LRDAGEAAKTEAAGDLDSAGVGRHRRLAQQRECQSDALHGRHFTTLADSLILLRFMTPPQLREADPWQRNAKYGMFSGLRIFDKH
jgi:hypothetical protein